MIPRGALTTTVLFFLRLASCQHHTPCDALDAVLPGKVIYQGTEAYSVSNRFWSDRQSELQPECFVLPQSAKDVSATVAILVGYNSSFTVKAGGHTAYAGSNIQEGITIDLRLMSSISVADDRSSVSLGPGARWGEVANALDPFGLAVVGGRIPNVGVSGLILGGGISFLSGRRGWACDNVQNFEVVLASGKIVNANPSKNSDLYWALRGGGGSNFGIVTRFDVNAYDQGDVWGRITSWPDTERQAVLSEFITISRDVLHIDRDAHIFYHLAYQGTDDAPLVFTFAFHLNHENSPGGVFNTFEGLNSLTRQLFNSTSVTSLGGQLELLRDVSGGRKTFWVTSISDGPASGQLLEEIYKAWKDTADSIRDVARKRNQTASFSLTVQPITNPTLKIMLRDGGNPLGLKPGKKFPIFTVHVLGAWEDQSLDDVIEKSWKSFFQTVDSMAESAGLANGFKYMNYGGRSQDIYGSYGAHNEARLRKVAKKYDPKGLLKSLWKGYYKL
ncbi:FAD-dependent monooxygenase yanF [Paramyrothecium foliicola]|nr:FAD-dependent monooxygenase yanF [Paramyrothecium foliicola]